MEHVGWAPTAQAGSLQAEHAEQSPARQAAHLLSGCMRTAEAGPASWPPADGEMPTHLHISLWSQVKAIAQCLGSDGEAEACCVQAWWLQVAHIMLNGLDPPRVGSSKPTPVRCLYAAPLPALCCLQQLVCLSNCGEHGASGRSMPVDSASQSLS